jgi:4-amino-4-deoxy-L-arabinose transferase-like glycosyltransferase
MRSITRSASPPSEFPTSDPDLSSQNGGAADPTLTPGRSRPPAARQALLAVGIFLLALWPRVVGLDTFVTTDEIFWTGRTGNFARAVADGQLSGTLQTGHPGVTTLWAGFLGMGAERAQRLAGDRREVSRSQVSRSADFLPGLTDARRVVAVATAIAVAGASLLAWRLLGPAPAVLGGTLLALDPFYLAHSQLLHIDALLTSFMCIALLAGLVRWLGGGGRAYLVISSVATGLALLSKSPAVFLLGFLPLVAAVAAWRRRCLSSRALWMDLLAWMGLAMATYVLCWPALWSAPVETLRTVVSFMADNANPQHSALAEGGRDAGPLFYVTAFALRTTPLVMLGLVLLAVEAAMQGVADSPTRADRSADPRPPLAVSRAAAAALLAYAVFFGLLMTVAAKSFDRYLLPAFPALDLLAGLGLALSARRLRWAGGVAWLLIGAFLLPVAVFPLAISSPYPLAWYNPLAGGGPAAERVLAVGWGEGLDQVARYLNARPNPDRLKAAMPGEIYTTVLDAQFAGQVMPLEGGDPSSNDSAYFVTYVRAPQDAPPVYDPRFQSWQPEYVVRLADIDYSRVYSAAFGVPIEAVFGEVARLEGYGLEPLVTRPGRPLHVKLFWRALAPVLSQSRVVVLLLDSGNREVARADWPLGPMEAGQARPRAYQLQLPGSLPAGEYLVWVGLESPSGEPLPLMGRPNALAPTAPEQPSLVVLRSVQVR